MTKELLQQALDALAFSYNACESDFVRDEKIDPAMKAIEQALAQQEPPGPATPEDMKIYKGIADGYRRDAAQQEPNPWQTAVIDQLVIHHVYQAAHDTDPRKAVHDLLCISNDIALDPQVSSDAQALIDRGGREAQQEQPASVDAYKGAREDVAIWKKRALEAEGLNRKFIADVNGPTYLGEPVKQEQPAQKVSESWTDIVAVNLVREGVNKHKARELAAHFLTLFAPPTPPAQEPVAWLHGTTFQVVVSKNRPNSLAAWLPLFAHPAPTQPALSDDEIWQFWCNRPEVPEGEDDSMEAEFVAACKRAIEAHCRGGANHG